MNERTFNGHTFDPDIINYPQVAARRFALFFLAVHGLSSAENPRVFDP